LRGGADRASYGVGDIVEFEVEKDVEAAVPQFADDGVAGGIVEFHADFEPLARVAKCVDQFEGLLRVGIVEGHCQAGLWIGHEVSLTFYFDGWEKVWPLCGSCESVPVVEESGSSFARMPTHAMRLHEWGTPAPDLHPASSDPTGARVCGPIFGILIHISMQPLHLLCWRFERVAESPKAQRGAEGGLLRQTWLDREHGRRTEDLRAGA